MQSDYIEGFRLSPQQRTLWSLQQSRGALPYRVCGTIHFHGPLDQEVLKKALQAVAQQHEILRTTFQCLPDMTIPVQIITTNDLFIKHIYDLSTETPEVQNITLETLFYEVQHIPFDIENGPLLAISLVTLSAKSHLLIVSLAALCADGASLDAFMQNIGHAYTSHFIAVDTVEEPMQYADLSEWQNELLEADDASEGRDYWDNWYRHTVPEAYDVKLPFEHRTTEESATFPAIATLTLDNDFATKIAAIAQQYDVTLPEFFCTALQILYWKLAGQVDCTLSIAHDLRQKYKQIANALGPLARCLPLHLCIEETLPFSTLVKQVHNQLADIFKWQEFFSWEQLYAKQNDTDLYSRFPLVGFEFIEYTHPYHGPDFTLSQGKLYTYNEYFKLKLLCVQEAHSFQLMFYYDPAVFAQADVQRLCDQFLTLTESILYDPETVIGALNMLSPQEKLRYLSAFNATKETTYPLDMCLFHLFEAEVEHSRDKIAINFEAQFISYSTFNECANQLAHYLQSHAVGPEVRVGICMERSPELLIGIMGILKAGGAYVPLDATLPAKRLAFILEDAQASLLLTQDWLLQHFTEQAIPIICLNQAWSEISCEQKTNPVCHVLVQNIAYVIYTSGSTGKPKGVMVTHRSVVNYLFWCTHAYAVAQGQGSLLHTSIGFDLTISSLFAPLLVGKPVVLLTEQTAINGLNTLLHYAGDFSLIKITPSHLDLFRLQLSTHEAAHFTRTFVIGGEQLHYENLSFWLKHAPNTRLINEYGPTETTVGCSVYEIELATPGADAVPIGYPIANMQMYLLDSFLHIVPTGAIGEIYIGGVGVARGYLDQPALTAERFVPNPFGDEPGVRLYMTGDLARYRPDGAIEFLGRKDNQIKMRSFRIELGEIESVLRQHPTLQNVVVVVREDSFDDKRIVAYVVCKEQTPSLVNDLRVFLQSKLPDYMIPAIFVPMDALPLTSNGKIAHQELPIPELACSTFLIITAPRDTVELQLVQIWSDLLNISPISVTDNFFDLGGHSLLAVRLIARIQMQFAVDLPLSTLFESATPEKVAHLLRKPNSSKVSNSLVKIRPSGSRPPLFLFHPVGGSVLCYMHLATVLDKVQPLYALQSPGIDGEREPFTSLEDMASYYIQEIVTVQPRGPYFLGGWSMGGTIAFEIAQQLHAQGQEIGLIALLDSGVPLAEIITGKISPEEYDDTTLLFKFAVHLAGLFSKDLTIPYDAMRQLSLDKQLQYILEQTSKANLVPPDTGLLQISRLFKVFKANYLASHTYIPQKYAGKLSIFLSQASKDLFFGPMVNGWQDLTSDDMHVQIVPGDHYSMLQKPHVNTMAKLLSEGLFRR